MPRRQRMICARCGGVVSYRRVRNNVGAVLLDAHRHGDAICGPLRIPPLFRPQTSAMRSPKLTRSRWM